jgi:hypothetical protein
VISISRDLINNLSSKRRWGPVQAGPSRRADGQEGTWMLCSIKNKYHKTCRIAHIHRYSKMPGGRGDVGEIFRMRGGFGPLASSIRYMDFGELFFKALR